MAENDDKGHPPDAAFAKGEPPAPDYDKEPVPRIGRGRLRKRVLFPPQQIISIFALIIGLVAVLGMKDSCARGAENLFRAFEAPPDAGSLRAPGLSPREPSAPPPLPAPPIGAPSPGAPPGGPAVPPAPPAPPSPPVPPAPPAPPAPSVPPAPGMP